VTAVTGLGGPEARGRCCRTLAAVLQRPVRPATALLRTAATALVVLCLALGLVRVAGELADQSNRAAAAGDLTSVDGVPVLPPVGEQGTRFLALARRIIPPGDAVRIVQPPAPPNPFETRRSGVPGVCGYRAAALMYFWLVYALAPRPSTCDATARWTLYYGVQPAAPPSGRRVYPFAPGYVLLGP
jgi:hypothetical protein